MAEHTLDASLKKLCKRMKPGSSEMMDIAAYDGLCSKLNQWRNILGWFREAVSVADKKQEWNVKVKRWLDDVHDLASAIENIMDKFAAQPSGSNIRSEERPFKNLISGCFAGSNPSAVNFDDSMSSNIFHINSRLEQLNMKRDELGLKIRRVIPESLAADLPTNTAIFGRDDDKTKILEMLLRDEPSNANFGIIPIIGTAGVGKTTVARLVYEDKAVEDFKQRAWVSVSEETNVLRISKAILHQITSTYRDPKDLNEVLIKLKEAIVGNKFLVVLDGVPSKNYGLWETLKSAFMTGAPGSKVIVTMRNMDCAFTIEPNIQPYNLKALSCHDWYSVLAEYALETDKDFKYENLKPFSAKIFEKCKGLPLTATILGSLLRDLAWEYLLDRKIWDLADDDEILPVLSLSDCYFKLHSNLRRCVAYCAILPKDYEFEEKDLILLWIAEGLIGGPIDDEEDRRNEYINCYRGIDFLRHRINCSLFQRSSNSTSKYRIHDHVRKMTQWISGETKVRLEDITGVDEREGEHLQTFLPGHLGNDDTHCITDMLLSDLLPKFKGLRALSLEKQSITELPNSVEGLRYLRYLNLSETMIKRLPDSICSLRKLQILLLRDCSCLLELPSDIVNLINLWHLDITGINLIREMPLEMNELICLRTLLNFIVGKDNGSDLKDLQYLKFLRELHISRLHNVTGSQDPRDFILIDKMDLKVLLLEWGSQLDDTRDELVEENVLDTLQPPPNLEYLTIKGYSGRRFSSWIGDPSFSRMVALTLERCENCTVLPSLGCLSFLQHLTIKGMTGIKRIGSEIFGEVCSNPFQLLETLCFEDLQEWEHWDPVEENKHVKIFRFLCELSLVKCPKLRGKLPEEHLPSLEKLTIQECGQLEVSFSSLPGFCEAEVDGCKMMCGTQN